MRPLDLSVCVYVRKRERSKFRLLRERERERGRTVKKGGEEKGLTNGGVPILKKFASVLVLDPIGFFFFLWLPYHGFLSLSLFFRFFEC